MCNIRIIFLKFNALSSHWRTHAQNWLQNYKKIPTYASIWGIILLFFVFCNGNRHFFTPVYSSTVLVEMVVVTLAVSVTCVYVAVVVIVRHALHDVMLRHTTMLISISDIKIYFLILSLLSFCKRNQSRIVPPQRWQSRRSRRGAIGESRPVGTRMPHRTREPIHLQKALRL